MKKFILHITQWSEVCRHYPVEWVEQYKSILMSDSECVIEFLNMRNGFPWYCPYMVILTCDIDCVLDFCQLVSGMK